MCHLLATSNEVASVTRYDQSKCLDEKYQNIVKQKREIKKYDQLSATCTWDEVNNYPCKPWNWMKLSGNSNITMEIVKANPNKPWNSLSLLIRFGSVPPILLKKIQKDWDWSDICAPSF